MQFPFGHPAVGAILVGVRSADEVEANVRDFTLPIPDDLWTELRAEGLLPEHVPVPRGDASLKSSTELRCQSAPPAAIGTGRDRTFWLPFAADRHLLRSAI